MLKRAQDVAGGKDVRIGGGATVVGDFLKAGRMDQLHVAINPILLGRGTRLWDGLKELEAGHVASSEVAQSGIIRVTFHRRP
ncbi:dihydrofolate reductase family protein [Arthrobacter sp. HLT1-20]